MYVHEAMLPNPVTTQKDESFVSLLRRVVNERQATAAVLDDGGRLLGVVGIHDILRRIVPHYLDLDLKLMEVLHASYFEERLLKFEDLPVGDMMSTDLDTVAPDDTLIKAASLIVERRRKTLPVIDAEGRFIGMLTRRSLLEHVVASTFDTTAD